MARERDNVQIAKALGADAVFYQTVNDMEHAVREEKASVEHFCNACFTGKYPTPDVTEDVLALLNQRLPDVKVADAAPAGAGGGSTPAAAAPKPQ